MRKIFILFTTIFFLSGCSIEYNLKIKNGEISESITYQVESKSKYDLSKNTKNLAFYSESRIAYYSLPEEKKPDFHYYKLKSNLSNNRYFLNYSYDFDLSNYSDSNAVRSCYEYFKVLTEGNNVTLSTSNSFNCFSISDELEKVTVNITSYYGVVQSNADKVNGKTYTWEITRENASNKPIIFVYDQSKKNITLIDYFTDNFYIVILLGILLFVVGPILLLIKRKNNKVNKI